MARRVYEVVMCLDLSMVEGEGDDERADFRVVEVVQSLREELGTAEIRLGVQPAVSRPGVQVPSGEPHVDRREAAKRTRQPAVDVVRERELAPFGERAILDELRADRTEAAAVVVVPGLPV